MTLFESVTFVSIQASPTPIIRVVFYHCVMAILNDFNVFFFRFGLSTIKADVFVLLYVM